MYLAYIDSNSLKMTTHRGGASLPVLGSRIEIKNLRGQILKKKKKKFEVKFYLFLIFLKFFFLEKTFGLN